MSEAKPLAPTALAASPRPDDARASEAARLLTADDLAKRWRVPRSQVYRLTRETSLPVVKLGRYYRYSLAAVEEFEARGGCSG